MKDIFICHASEDKSAVVRPLAHALHQQAVSCWVDEAEIKLGDSITKAVNDGLAESRFVVVVLSRSFLSKNWPQRELWSVLNMEARTGEVKILPILVGSATDIEYVLSKFPLLSDKLYFHWDGAANPVAAQIRAVVHGTSRPLDDKPEMGICGKCRSPFEHGVLICLGCRRSVVYGATEQERNTFYGQSVVMLLMTSTMGLMIGPNFVRSKFGIDVPNFWGLPLFQSLVSCFFGAMLISILITQYWVKTKSHLIRTF